jgi:hypothetical protein
VAKKFQHVLYMQEKNLEDSDHNIKKDENMKMLGSYIPSQEWAEKRESKYAGGSWRGGLKLRNLSDPHSIIC